MGRTGGQRRQRARSASHIASRQALETLLAGFYEVFERFYTADQMRTGQNTGLGLAIVKALVQRMGYAAFAELENGTFTVGVRWMALEQPARERQA